MTDSTNDDLNAWEFLLTFCTIFVLLAGIAYGVFYWYHKQYLSGKFTVRYD